MAWMVRRELKKLPELLGEDEHVLNLARGEYDGREGLMALTGRRILFLEQGMMRHRLEDFRYERVTFGDYVRSRISGESGPITAATAPPRAPAESSSATDPMDQLRKLGELRDAGLPTARSSRERKRNCYPGCSGLAERVYARSVSATTIRSWTVVA